VGQCGQGMPVADGWAPATVTGGGGLNLIQIQIQTKFKWFQILANPKRTFPSSKILK
jgi:hypothetical protein